MVSIFKSFSFGRRGEDKGFIVVVIGEFLIGGVIEDVIFFNVGVMMFVVCFCSLFLELCGDF